MERPSIPLVGVVLCIAFGTMIFIIVFCFVKRQITRFTLRSSRAHALIGADASKAMRTEIDRRLRRVKDIQWEPRLLTPAMEEKLQLLAATDPNHHLYRMKAVDSLALLDAELRRCNGNITRRAGVQLKIFLHEQRQSGPLEGTKVDLVDKFSKCYDHARHDPAPFTHAHYQEFVDLLNHLIANVQVYYHANRLNESRAATQGEEFSPLLTPTNLRFTLGKDEAQRLTGDLKDTEVTYRPNRSQNSGNFPLIDITTLPVSTTADIHANKRDL